MFYVKKCIPLKQDLYQIFSKMVVFYLAQWFIAIFLFYWKEKVVIISINSNSRKNSARRCRQSSTSDSKKLLKKVKSKDTSDELP